MVTVRKAKLSFKDKIDVWISNSYTLRAMKHIIWSAITFNTPDEEILKRSYIAPTVLIFIITPISIMLSYLTKYILKRDTIKALSFLQATIHTATLLIVLIVLTFIAAIIIGKITLMKLSPAIYSVVVGSAITYLPVLCISNAILGYFNCFIAILLSFLMAFWIINFSYSKMASLDSKMYFVNLFIILGVHSVMMIIFLVLLNSESLFNIVKK